MEAEDDCTTALSLDNTVVKAYFRRAMARQKLGKLKDAMNGTALTYKLEV